MLIAEFLAAALWWCVICAVVFGVLIVGKALLDYFGEKVYGRMPDERSDRDRY